MTKDQIPEPLPPGTPIYSSGSGWIPDGSGGRLRATPGVIVTAMEYRTGEGPNPNWSEPCWAYLVQWEGHSNPTSRSDKCLSVMPPLEALARAADGYTPQCWLCPDRAEFEFPGDLCEACWNKWADYKIRRRDLIHLSSEIRGRFLDTLLPRHKHPLAG